MSKKRKTPNQIEYAKQIRNLKRRIKTAENAGYYFGVNQIIPDRPSTIRKKDIERLYNIRGDKLYSQAERQWGYERPQTRKERMQESAKRGQTTRYLAGRLRDRLESEYGYSRSDLRKMNYQELSRREEIEDTAQYYREQQYWDEYDTERRNTINKLVTDYNYSEAKIRDYSLYDLEQLPNEWQVSEQEKPYREALVKAIEEYADYIPATLDKETIKRMSTDTLESFYNLYVEKHIPLEHPDVDETALNNIEDVIENFHSLNNKQAEKKYAIREALEIAIERDGREAVAKRINDSGNATTIANNLEKSIKYEDDYTEADAFFNEFIAIVSGRALSMDEAEELESDYEY